MVEVVTDKEMASQESTTVDIRSAVEILHNLINMLTGGKKLIDISRNGVAVNFLGFSAGIGVSAGHQDGNADGGLSVSASTPWGSEASAGIRGNAGTGGLGGGLWANAAAVSGVEVTSGLGGNIATSSMSGGLTASAKTPFTGEKVSAVNGQMKL